MLGTERDISFNGNKIIAGSSGGMLLMDSEEDANKIRSKLKDTGLCIRKFT